MGYGQFDIETSEVIEGDVTNTRVTAYFKVTNMSADDQLFFWSIDMSNCPQEWDYSVCDNNTCYDWNVDCPCSNPAMIVGSGFFEFTLYINSNGVAADATPIFKTHMECDPGSASLGEGEISYSISQSSSTADIDVQKLMIFPNPTVDGFKINDDSNVSFLSIYNIVGKEIYADTHSAGQSHNVSNLEKGIYLVRLMDNKKDVLKVIRMTKSGS